jgi:hypothetical protein
MRLVLIPVLLLAACGPVSAPSSSPTTSPTTSASATINPASTDACHQAGVIYCALNPSVTQSDIDTTICRSGWTKTIRPPATYTRALKLQQIKAEGLTGPVSSYEEDHRVPLELGGAPRDPMNLSPEAGASPNPKDHDESTFRELVCSGQLTLAEAQQQFIAKWLAAYPGYRQ